MRAVSQIIFLVAILVIAGSSGARSQTASDSSYPNRMVRFIVPLGAGSVTDILARVIADKLTEIWKQQVIVENKPRNPRYRKRRQQPAGRIHVVV